MRYFNNFHPGVAIRALLIVFALSALSGCSKDELLTSNGTVVDTGAFGSGGCEWALILTTGYHEPHNLPLEFQVDGLAVQVTYRVLQRTANCPNAQNYQGLIHLNRIKRI